VIQNIKHFPAALITALGKLDEVASSLAEVWKLDPKLADQYAWVATAGSHWASAKDAMIHGLLRVE